MGFQLFLWVCYGAFIHLVLFSWVQWCTHKASVLFHLPSSFPLRVQPFSPEPHTPLISSSCLFNWVIGSIMCCGTYLWARMLYSAHWGHSCQQECQRDFVKLNTQKIYSLTEMPRSRSPAILHRKLFSFAIMPLFPALSILIMHHFYTFDLSGIWIWEP